MTTDFSPSNKSLSKPFFSIVRLAASIIVLSLGLLVIIGWHLNNQLLIQVLPTFVPMQYNTALGFLLCGLALLFSLKGYKKVVFALSLAIFTLGILTLSQYIFGIDFRIDQLFMRHYIDVKTSHPGRMAPNTALCFTLSSLAILISHLEFKLSSLMASLIGAVITGLGFVSFFGYLANIPTAYSWGQLTAMAVHTSFGFIFIGLTIISLMWNKIAEDKKGLLLQLPILVAISGITITICLWQAVYYQERAVIDKATQLEAENVSSIALAELKTQVLALERMAERWSVNSSISREQWEKDALRYIKDYGSYQAIEWVDKDFVVRWVVPLEGNEKALGLNLAFEENRQPTLESAKNSKKTIMTRPVDLTQGGKGILIYCPIYNGEKFDGFILGVLKVKDLYQSILADGFQKEYSIKILSENEEIFRNGVAIQNEKTDPFGIDVRATKSFKTFGITWEAIVAPKQKVSIFSNFSLDDLTLIFGLLITALLGLQVYLYQRSVLDSKAKTIANTELNEEVKERKRIEEALRETSTFRQAILNSANYMIISTDIDGTILTFNKMAEELLGYKSEEVVGKFSPEIIHIEDEVIAYAKELNKEGFELTSGFEAFIAKAKHDIIDEREWNYVHKDGRSFPVMLSVSALRNENNVITGFLGIGKDISELKKTEQKLLESEKRFNVFMENTPTGAFIKDDKGRYVYVNEQLEESFNIKSEQLIGKTDFEWLPEHIADRIKTTEAEIIKEHKVLETTDIVPKPDGSKSYWLFIKFPITKSDGTTYIGGVAIDVTESKNLEKELMKTTDAALESVRLKSEFLANMSHEIRTPMNGVLGMTEILLDTNLNSEQLDYARTIQTSAESLLTIINDILDFSKIEAGKIVFDIIDFDLRNTVENTIGIFTEEVERKNLEILSLVEMDVPTAIKGDPGRLKQVLINLIGNAIKFTEEGDICVRVSKVSETQTDIKLKFAITDTGIGIDPKAQKYLFQAFTQADGSMTRKYGGTGLGLTISKQLVEMMKGDITVESELHKGSTFNFTATFEKQIEAKPKDITPIKNLKNLRALIVDDNSTNREIITHQVKSWGMNSKEAHNAEKALKLLNQASKFGFPFDIVFLDLMMPDTDGFELAQLIRKQEEFADTKLILMPSFGKRGHAKDALKFGIDAYLVKPIRQSDLFDCIATVMGNIDFVKDKKSKKLVTRHTISEKRFGKKFRILIAEDNLINQKVAKSQVQNLGYKADIVSNGIEVLEALKKHEYSLILMDCQMPEMDGYEVTEQIRLNENDETHIPIIAITANALDGEKEKCINAGMDDYLAKPFKQNEFKQILEKWLAKSPSVNGQEKTFDQSDFLPNVPERLNELKDEVGAEMLDMIISLFIEDSVSHLQTLRKSIETNDLETVTSEVHSLQGSVANMGAINLVELCSEFAIKAKTLEKNQLESQFAKIESSFLMLFEVIESLDLQLKEGSKAN